MLKFEHVSKIYKGQKRAVNNLNLQMNEGEFICFIGPSGCGKTTTMKMINRLIEPTEGAIYLKEKNIMEMDPVELRRKIGYVIQQIGLFPHMTIEQNISLVPRLLRWPLEKQKKRASELLSLVNMTSDYLHRYPSELSGGQQQRIGVLRALAADQPLILMDEPFGALDPITRDSLQTELKKLQQKLNKTIVFVTHDMDEAIKLADRIVIMKDGEIVQFATPDEILRNPANEFVEEFIGRERLSQVQPHIQTVDQIMNPAPVTVTPNVFLSEAIRLMKQKRVDSLLVVNRNNKLEGYIDFEMIDQKRSQASRVAEVVEKDILKVETGTFVRDTIQTILKRGLKYVPVVDHDGRLVGIVTRTNLVDVVYDSIWGNDTEGIAQ
ncbi:betaine/proline/choline family ABC transporter ATP-binding protein [Bacillus andreraoultii]|uniref:betaine/proline/choline family ABC transporter ATP-binding protein n=1 Tax=Bacillus andreraoultii TaxID=1499685 RepID=UPI00053A0892|nr:betaine/proline/choline family ABC transporter ATP-binding protein [Bacillus andreraoultii]